MNSNSKSPISGDLISKKPNRKDVVSSAGPTKAMDSSTKSPVSGDLIGKKPNGKDVVSSTEPVKRDGQTGVTIATDVSGDPKKKKPNVKAVVSSAELIRHVKFGPQEGELRFRLIHFREARNALMKILIGLEMLLIDEQGTVIQGFIPPSRIDTYLPHMIAGSIYRLNKFYGSKSKIVYWLLNQTLPLLSHGILSSLNSKTVRFSFLMIGSASMDMKNLKRPVTSRGIFTTLNDSLVLDEVEIASTRRILVHVQTHDGPVMKLYLWDKAATDFCEKFKAHGNTPSVILVTTVNPKQFGGSLALSSLSSSLSSNPDFANRVNAEIATKSETVTIGELFSYIKQEETKVAWFECIATINDVVHRSAWYYIACGGCKTKATKGPTTLMCKKCGKAEVAGVAEYLTKLSVYDNDDQAFFVLIGDTGRELTGKPASELVDSYYETNENVGDDHVIPVPQALLGTIGQTHKFIVKVSKHNLEGKTQALTVTKVLPSEAPAPEGNLEENVIVHSAEETLQMGNREDDPSIENEEAADEVGKMGSDGLESGKLSVPNVANMFYVLSTGFVY
ncbi:hypothetical protein Bca101_096591 [Brassica carinata]